MGQVAHLERSFGLLIVNPRSGTGAPGAAELEQEAASKGLDVHVLADGDDAQAIAREAAGPIGVAGGDGSLGPVAHVAMELDLPFVCVPFGTRNHFARDIGLDRSNPVGALAAFGSSRERLIDVGRVGTRTFLLASPHVGRTSGRALHDRTGRRPARCSRRRASRAGSQVEVSIEPRALRVLLPS